MALSDLARSQYAEKFVNIPLGSLTNVDKDAYNVVATFVCPRNMKLKGVGVSYNSGDASGSGLTAQAQNSAGTALATSPSITGTAPAGDVSEDVDVFVSKGQVLLIAIKSVNDTDDFTGASVVLVFEAPKTED